MRMTIRTAAVLGAGVMGAQIAAHFANAGVRVRLLDVTADAARDGLARARKLKPEPFFTSDAVSLIETGGFDDGLARIDDADWIVEAIVERLDAKQALMTRVDAVRRPDAIVSSNTSGIPVASIAEGRSDGFRRHWLGTHFFNPPRYLHLLELIPTPDTDSEVVRLVDAFCDLRLGKGVVRAKDAPGFIANRIGVFGAVQALHAVERGDCTIEELDAITGAAIGRPKSATFRTLDIAGIDVLAHVARTLRERLPDPAERAAFALPAFVDAMIARGMVGAKNGRGFYEKRGDDILTLDPRTLEYRSRQAPQLPAIEATKAIESTRERIRALYNGTDRVGEFLRATVGPTLEYAARIAPDVAYTPDDVDNAMRWGFGWEVGPLETLRLVNSQLPSSNSQLPTANLQPSASNLQPPTSNRRIVRANPGASLIDLGDGVLQIEFHSKMNAIGGDTMEIIQAGVAEASKNFAAIVVANGAVNFSAGANLMLLLLEAQEGNWEDVDLMVRAFQGATMALKYADVPVVVAPAGLALGGACELALHGARVQAAAETYIGLVEVGVGLIPAGGGTKEMLARAMEASALGEHADVLPAVQRVFETIGFAKVATSAADARRIGYLRDGDGVTMNRDRLLDDAKTEALALAHSYRPPQPRAAIRVGGEGVQAALKLGVHLAWRAGRISDHDALIGRTLARILAGGDLAHPGTITEQQMLDLEREAFLSLCGEPKTLERIAYTLKHGRPLRN
jgi:3-hydroxyacyl-CoA dehydrogenase